MKTQVFMERAVVLRLESNQQVQASEPVFFMQAFTPSANSLACVPHSVSLVMLGWGMLAGLHEALIRSEQPLMKVVRLVSWAAPGVPV